MKNQSTRIRTAPYTIRFSALKTATALALSTLVLSACSMPMHSTMADGEQGAMGGSQMSGMSAMSNNPFTAANARMMQDMHNNPPSGDVDYDFVVGMIPHHQGAVDMSTILLESGQADAELAELANEIITAQSDEMAFMETWLRDNPEPQPDARAAEIIRAYQASMMTMMGGMHGERDADINTRFVTGMIPHHQAAIEMAEVVLEYSDDTQLRTMAQAVVREQNREISEMRDWLSRQ
ncbi:DUF305 domain-containing protein [Saccharospirillum impatiens]|uniref:DUF305 domain-containing protein n=1 Tax=Saccharospirillum impatiens TaxID=169438 RepID=UPI00068843C0|nr:DUF305 domain-containing protein [Saccharospirillum impatiens]